MLEKEETTYREFLEILKIEFGSFLRKAEAGRTIRHAALSARKHSIRLRELFKEFRKVSLGNDQKISDIMEEAKQQINVSTGGKQGEHYY